MTTPQSSSATVNLGQPRLNQTVKNPRWARAADGQIRMSLTQYAHKGSRYMTMHNKHCVNLCTVYSSRASASRLLCRKHRMQMRQESAGHRSTPYSRLHSSRATAKLPQRRRFDECHLNGVHCTAKAAGLIGDGVFESDRTQTARCASGFAVRRDSLCCGSLQPRLTVPI